MYEGAVSDRWNGLYYKEIANNEPLFASVEHTDSTRLISSPASTLLRFHAQIPTASQDDTSLS